MKLKIKKLVRHAELPTYAKPGDAGMDLFAADSGYKDMDYGFTEYGTGIAVEIPEGYVGLVFPRSSISKTPFSLANSIGVIDSGYRGEIKVRFRTLLEDRESLEYDQGDRIAQLMILPYPKIEIEEVKELSDSARGTGGFGSTGKAEVFTSDNLFDNMGDLDGQDI